MADVGSSEFDALIRLLRATSAEAVPAAENAAAEVYQKAAQAAAPRETGGLAGSVKIIEGKPVGRNLTGSTRNRLFVGPEKKKGFHGYFIEKGWIATGRRRRQRSATMTTRSQRGVTEGRRIPGKPWFEPAIRNADSSAVAAAEAAFNAKLEELNKRG